MRHSPLPSSLGFQFQSVAIQDLAFPDHFTSTLYPDANVSLCDQVQNFGLLEPLPVQRQADHSYHLLAGYAYLPVLRHAGSQAVWCQIVTEEAPPFSFFALQILHGLSTVAASPILQAHLLRQARQTLAEEETLRLLPLMGHKPQRYKAQELLALLNLAPEAILALHQGFLTPKSGKALSRLSFEDQQYLVALILRYRPGGSKQQKLVELLTELSLRHNTSLERLTQSCLNGQQENPPNLPQQFQVLLQYLHEQCFPHLADAEKRFQQFIEKLAPPPQVRLNHSLSFEDESMEVIVRFPNQTSLQQSWSILSHLPSGQENQGVPPAQ